MTKGKRPFSVADMVNELREDRTDDIWDAAISLSNVGTKLQLRPDDRPVRWRKPRLDREDYRGRRTYHITLITAGRNPAFDYRTDARPCENALKAVAEKLNFRILAYCFMPDHLHVLLKGQALSSDLLRFVQRFKQVTSFHFKQKWGAQLWQQSFFDRVLRKDEDPRNVAEYIFDNPAVAGLVRGSAAFELRGGEFFDARPDGAEASSLHESPGVERGTDDEPP